MLEELSKDIRLAAEGIIEQAQVDRGSQWIEAFANEYPVAHGILISAIYKEPKDVMKFLCVLVPELRQYRNNPHALKYIALLQEKLRGKRDAGQRTDRDSKSILPSRRSGR